MDEPSLRSSNLIAALQRFSEKYRDDPNLFPNITPKATAPNIQIPVHSIPQEDL